MDIQYGPDQQRWKTIRKKHNSIEKTIIFVGEYEKVTENGVTKEFIYLPGGIHVKQSGQSDKIYYTHKDHLGSIISITDANGSPVFKAEYDAWGNQTLDGNNTFKFHRGYTGHEHLPEFGLINMNGRMYNPIVGRFLSLFQHEYGHYLQSQEMVPVYLQRVGLPSLMSVKEDHHDFQGYEQDANRRAFMYFNEHEPGFYQSESQYQANQKNGIEKGWDFHGNPLDDARNTYRDYYHWSPNHRGFLNSLSFRARWHDYLFPFGLFSGFSNGKMR